MVTTGGAEGETKRKRKFVARTEGRKPEGKRKKGRKRKREREIPDILSWLTYFVVDEASRFFVSTPLCFVILFNFLRPKIRKHHTVHPSPPSLFKYVT